MADLTQTPRRFALLLLALIAVCQFSALFVTAESILKAVKDAHHDKVSSERPLALRVVEHMRTSVRKKFTSDEAFTNHVESHHNLIKDHVKQFRTHGASFWGTTAGKTKSISDKKNVIVTKNNVYPFIVEYDLAACGASSCHDHMVNQARTNGAEVGMGRYEILSTEFAIVTTTWEEMEQLPFVKEFMVLHPDLKLSKEVLSMSSTIDGSSSVDNESKQTCLFDHVRAGSKYPLPKPVKAKLNRAKLEEQHNQAKQLGIDGINMLETERTASSDFIDFDLSAIDDFSYNFNDPGTFDAPAAERQLRVGEMNVKLHSSSKSSKSTKLTPHPFKLRIELHNPNSIEEYDDFLQFLQDLEDEFNGKNTASPSLVIGEVFMNLDEQAGYYGARRQQAKRSIAAGNAKSALTFQTRSRAIPTSQIAEAHGNSDFSTIPEEIFGELHIHDCSKVYEIAQRLASRPEIVSVTRQYPNHATNQWAQYTGDTSVQGYKSIMGKSFTGTSTVTSQIDVVGVADTGIDMYNLYFYDYSQTVLNYQTTISTTVLNTNHRKVIQYITYGDNKEDGEGHGSHVCGSIAGKMVNPSSHSSEAVYNGISVDAKLAFFDIGVNGEEYLYTPLDLNKDLFARLLPSGAKIFSNSWGSSANYYDSDARTSDVFMWQHPETLILFAAGNDGDYGINTVGSPATGKNALAVGAGMSDKDSWYYLYGVDKGIYNDIDTVAYFSSQGPTEDGRIKPEIVSPGYWILSALGTNTSTAPFADYTYMAGTSMATPVTSSYAVKVRRYFIDGYYPTGIATTANSFIPSGALIKAIMIHSGHKMTYGYNAKKEEWKSMKYPSIIQGYGRLLLNNTLKFTPSTTYKSTYSYGTGSYSYSTAYSTIQSHDLFVIGNAKNFSTIATSTNKGLAPKQYVFKSSNVLHTFYLRTNSTSSSSIAPLRITMVYTDYPATVQASNVMINYLELTVSEQGSTTKTYSPYVGSGVTASLNNVQMIDIPSPLSDTIYAINVYASRILVANQSYALVVTGAFTMEDNGHPSIVYQQVSTKAPSYSPPIDTGGDDDYVNNSTTTKSDSNSKNGLSTSTIITIVVVIGVVVLIAILVSVFFWCYQSCCSRSNASTVQDGHGKHTPVPSAPPPAARPSGPPPQQFVPVAVAVPATTNHHPQGQGHGYSQVPSSGMEMQVHGHHHGQGHAL